MTFSAESGLSETLLGPGKTFSSLVSKQVVSHGPLTVQLLSSEDFPVISGLSDPENENICDLLDSGVGGPSRTET